MAKILIVDDQEIIRLTLKGMLEAEGHSVIMANNGLVAVEKFEQEKVDAVFTDVFMPEQEGLQTLKEILGKRPGIRVAVMSSGSAFSASETLHQAKVFGATVTIEKPLTEENVRDALSKIL